MTGVAEAYQADGLTVTVDARMPTFARLIVTDPTSGRQSKVEMAADWRANTPVSMAIGPVLHPDDAVANKMAALYGRAQCRDFIDIDGALTSGRYERARPAALAEAADGGFDRRMFADALAAIDRFDADAFAEYEVGADQMREMRARFAAWRSELLAPPATPSIPDAE